MSIPPSISRPIVTHFIRIPLLNQASSSQIQETLWQVANDPVSASVPHTAYRPLQRLSLSIAGLYLPTEESKHQAITLLQHLGKHHWRALLDKAQPAASSNAQISSTRNPESRGNESLDQFSPRPLLVDLVGLGYSALAQGPQDFEKITRLYTFVQEPMGLLQSLCTGLSHEFTYAGLETKQPFQDHVRDRQFGQALVIDTKGLRAGHVDYNPRLKRFSLDSWAKFDGRGLCEKFKDVVWGKGIHLDRVCISAKKPHDIVEDMQCMANRYYDIASVPLPGVTWEPRSFEYLRLPQRRATAESQGEDRA